MGLASMGLWKAGWVFSGGMLFGISVGGSLLSGVVLAGGFSGFVDWFLIVVHWHLLFRGLFLQGEIEFRLTFAKKELAMRFFSFSRF